MRSRRLAAAYPHSTENWRISACDNECSRTYRSPGNPSDGSRPRCARHRRCAPKNCASSGCAFASHSDTFASESRRNNPSPRTSAAGTHSAGPRRSGANFAVESSPPDSSRVNPANACTSRKRSIGTTLSIHGAYFAGGVSTRKRKFALFFAGSGFENSFHSGSFKSLGVRGAALSCGTQLLDGRPNLRVRVLSYRAWPFRTSLTSRSDSASSNSDVRSCSTNCSSGSADDGMESADSVRENHILVAPRVMGCDWRRIPRAAPPADADAARGISATQPCRLRKTPVPSACVSGKPGRSALRRRPRRSRPHHATPEDRDT